MIVSAKKTLIEKNFSITLDKHEALCYLKTVLITIIERKEESDGHIEIQPPERIY